MKAIAARILFIALLGLCGWLVYDRFFVTDEARVRRAIATMQKAVEDGNVPALVGAIAHDYSDEWGMDRAMLVGAVRETRRHFSKLTIRVSQLKVKTEGAAAEAVLIAVASGTDNRGVEVDLTEDLRSQVGGRFRLGFVKTQDGWKLHRVENIRLEFL